MASQSKPRTDVDNTGTGPGTDVDTPEVVEGVVVEAAQRAAQLIAERGYGPNTIQVVQYIAANAVDTADLNVVIIEQMNARLMSAEDPDDILDPFSTVKGEEMHGRPIHVTGCSFIESDYTEGFPYYVTLAFDDPQTGRSKVVTVGGEKVVMQAAHLDMRDAWPRALVIHRSEKPTKAGFYPLELRPTT